MYQRVTDQQLAEARSTHPGAVQAGECQVYQTGLPTASLPCWGVAATCIYCLPSMNSASNVCCTQHVSNTAGRGPGRMLTRWFESALPECCCDECLWW